MTGHPFQPGTKVAVAYRAARFQSDGQPNYWKTDEVLKVHKNGNFTLKSAPKQQWRGFPSRADYDGKIKIAEASDARHYYGKLYLLADISKRVTTDNEAYARWMRWRKISVVLDSLRYPQVSDRSISLFEEAIANLNPKEPK